MRSNNAMNDEPITNEAERKRTRWERVNEARRIMRQDDPDGIDLDYAQCNSCKLQDSTGSCEKAQLYPLKGPQRCYHHEKK